MKLSCQSQLLLNVKWGLRWVLLLTVDPINDNIPALFLADKGIHRINTVIECAGLPATIKQAISLAGNKSVVMMFGLTKPDDEVAIKPFEIFQKEIEIKSSFHQPIYSTTSFRLNQ